MTATFILSLDTEIAWGTYTAAGVERSRAVFDDYRNVIRQLLDLLQTYEVPATWAVVGHLFLNPSDPHPDVETPHYRWSPVPDADRAHDPAHPDWYYAPDVVDMIATAPLNHDIGTHTFTHVLAGEDAVTREMFDAQLAACVALHQQRGLTLKSIVYPRNQIAYTDLLPKHGIIAYRGAEHTWYKGIRSSGGRAAHLIDRALAFPPPTYTPAALREGEVVNLPASQFLLSYDGVRGYVPTASRVRQARLGLDRAEQRGELYHLWFHPFNLSLPMFNALEQILQIVAQQRDREGLRVLTMAQAASEILPKS